MIHTNHGELIRIFDTYCRVWGAGGQATLTTSTEGGVLKANLDIQLGPPTAACPGAPPPHLQRQTAWTSPSSSTPAPGRPGAGSRRHRRRRRHRGPAAKARSNARAAAHQASLAAAEVGASPVPPPQPPPPQSTVSTRLIKFVGRKASLQPTFSQLDGEGGSVESESEDGASSPTSSSPLPSLTPTSSASPSEATSPAVTPQEFLMTVPAQRLIDFTMFVKTGEGSLEEAIALYHCDKLPRWEFE